MLCSYCTFSLLIRSESANRKQSSDTRLKSRGFKKKEISCFFFPLFHLHFTAIKEEEGERTKWALRGSGFDYPHTLRSRRRERERACDEVSEKRELPSREMSKYPPVEEMDYCIYVYGFVYVKQTMTDLERCPLAAASHATGNTTPYKIVQET